MGHVLLAFFFFFFNFFFFINVVSLRMLQLCFVGKLWKCVVDFKNSPEGEKIVFISGWTYSLRWHWKPSSGEAGSGTTVISWTQTLSSNTIICLRYAVSATCHSVLYMQHLLHVYPSWRARMDTSSKGFFFSQNGKFFLTQIGQRVSFHGTVCKNTHWGDVIMILGHINKTHLNGF